MKKMLIYVLALLVMLNALPAFAETVAPDIQYDYDELVVGTITPFNGSFYGGMWGNIASDLDVRALIHGYNLVTWGEDDRFEVDPSVVSGFAVKENAQGDRVYSIALCDDLYYSNGEKITARDYAFTLLLSCAPEIGKLGGSARALDFLAGYEAYRSGRSRVFSGIRVPADNMLEFEVGHEYLPYFHETGRFDCTPSPIAVIAPGCSVKDDGEGAYIDGPFDAELLKKTLLDPETGYVSHPEVTSGPYRLVSYDGNTARFEINDYYKGNARGNVPSIRRLVYRVVGMEDMMALYEKGEIGLLSRCMSADIVEQGLELLPGSESFAVTEYGRNGLGYISFCCEKPATGSAAVRKAVSLCTDKDALVAETVGVFGRRVDGYYGIGQWMVECLSGARQYPVEMPDMDAPDEEQEAYEQAIEAWKALSLDGATVYNLDVDAAKALLEADGWTLNAEGGAYDAGVDAVRCKAIGGELVPLSLRLICPAGSEKARPIRNAMADNLAQAGIELTVEELPLSEVAKAYYRGGERDCDMIFMATNFDVVFDPSLVFKPDGEAVNAANVTGIADEELSRLAAALNQTEPDDLLGYMNKWIAFQERFQEVAPMLPLYSGVYFDFYPKALRNYDVSGTIGWSQAIINAYMSDVPDEVTVD